MNPYRTPKARSGRVGIWASPLFAAVLLLLFLAVTPLMPPAQGDTLKEQLDKKAAALEQTNATLQALAAEATALQKNIDSAAAKVADLDGEITEVQAAIEQAEADMEILRVQLEDRLVDIYKNGGSWSAYYFETLMVEENLGEILNRFEMLSKIAEEDDHLFTQVESYRDQSRTDKALLEQKRVEQKAQLDGLVESQKQLAAKQAQIATQKSSLQSQIASLNEQIRQAEAAAAASAAARVKAVSDSASKVGGTGGTTYSGGNSSSATYPSSAAQVQAQASFIERTYLAPRKSVLSGMQIMEIWRKYGITPAQSLAVLNAESGMGSLRWGGRLVSEGNNFGCMSYGSNPTWASWSPPISFGKIVVGGRTWMRFYSVADGIEAWGRYIAYGRGRDCYRPLLRAADWLGFANIYYGANVAGKAKYIERVTWAYGMLKSTSAAAGYSW